MTVKKLTIEEIEKLYPLVNTGRDYYVNENNFEIVNKIIELYFSSIGYSFWNNPFPGVETVTVVKNKYIEFEYIERNWVEDLEHENGQYINKCVYCDSSFQGHKRRVVCKNCTSKIKDNLPEETEGKKFIIVGAGQRDELLSKTTVVDLVDTEIIEIDDFSVKLDGVKEKPSPPKTKISDLSPLVALGENHAHYYKPSKPLTYYGKKLDGIPPKRQNRNSLCNCGSGKKFKKCCWKSSRID